MTVAQAQTETPSLTRAPNAGLSVAQASGVWGAEGNAVAAVHPAYNVRAGAVAAAQAHFRGAPSGHTELLALAQRPQRPRGPRGS